MTKVFLEQDISRTITRTFQLVCIYITIVCDIRSCSCTNKAAQFFTILLFEVRPEIDREISTCERDKGRGRPIVD